MTKKCHSKSSPRHPERSEGSISNVGCANISDQMTNLAKTAGLSLALSFFIAAPVMADAPVPTLDRLNQEGATIPDTDPPQVYPESAYKLEEIPNADPNNLPQNAITLYEKQEVIKYYDPTTGEEVAANDRQPDVEYREVKTYVTTPKYYLVSLKQTEYGHKDAAGAVPYYYKWTNDGTGLKLESATETEAQLTYWADPTRLADERITTDEYNK